MFTKTKRWFRAAVWIVLLALGFTQMVAAAQLCMQPAATVAVAGDDCHYPDSASADLCLKQCIGGDLVSSTILPVVALPPLMPVFIVPLPADGMHAGGAVVARADPVVDPPIPIRFCSFLI